MKQSIHQVSWNRAVRSLYAVSAIFVVLGCSGEKSKTLEPKIASDHSLPAIKYIALGIPAPDRTWNPRDYERAAQTLLALGKSDYTKLPRLGSTNSGGVFSRICSTNNWDILLNRSLPLAQRFPAMLSYMDGISVLLKVYSEPTYKGDSFDTEIVELISRQMDLAPLFFALTDEFLASLPADDPKREVRMDGLRKMIDGYTQILHGSLIVLSEEQFFRLSERIRLVRHLAVALPPVLPRLPELTRAELPIRIKKLSDSEMNPDLKKALNDLHAVVTLK